MYLTNFLMYRNMKKNNKYIWVLLSALLIGIFITNCKDDDDLGNPNRLFRPIIKDYSYSGTWIKIEWDRYEGANQFELQLSVDSFATFVENIIIDTTIYTFENLEYDTEYQLRIRSLGDVLNSEFFVNRNITTSDYPTKLITPTFEDMIDKQIRVKWTDIAYDSLGVFKGDTLVQVVALTPADNDAGEIIISQLEPLTTYKVKAYLDGNYMGKKTFNTTAAQVFEGAIIDLRDSVYSYELFTSVVNNLTAENYPGGVTIVLEGGKTYEMEGPQIVTGLHVVTGLSLSGYATMEVTGNFDAPAAVDVDKVKLERIIFTEHPDKPKTDANFGGSYIFNFSQSDVHIGKITIEDCDIRYKRGLFRIKAATIVDSVIINNCVVDSIAGYGILNMDNEGCVMYNIIITNSTFSHVPSYLVRADKDLTTVPNSLYIENITTCHMPDPGSFLISLNNKTYDGGITIKDCLFGQAQTDNSSVRGFRSASSNITLSNNYKTSDLTWEPPYELECTDLGNTSEEIFADPYNNDFTVSDDRLVDKENKVGDPRWWK